MDAGNAEQKQCQRRDGSILAMTELSGFIPCHDNIVIDIRISRHDGVFDAVNESCCQSDCQTDGYDKCSFPFVCHFHRLYLLDRLREKRHERIVVVGTGREPCIEAFYDLFLTFQIISSRRGEMADASAEIFVDTMC